MGKDGSSGNIFYKLALEYSWKYRGKVEIIPKVPVQGLEDFAVWYTPGVAELARRIHSSPELSFEITGRWNTIAVVSDGTRVLGLGRIGPEAAYPVMEGKALIFKYLGGVDALPLVVREHDPDKIVELLKALEPSFGGVNLEDIESPKCFYLLDKARKELEIPVWHDDQQGTATVVLAGLINALKLVGKSIGQVKIVLVGVGAANTAIYRLLKAYGVDPGNIIAVEREGILHPSAPYIEDVRRRNPYQYTIALETNREGRLGGIPEALEGADVLIAASKPGPGTIRKEWISRMADDAIVFALANPVPEIWPWEAREAGARIVATGRSDFPNQLNNSLAFPSIFRGALDVRAKTISDGMTIAAAEALASYAEERGLSVDYIIPRMDETEVYPRVAAATAVKAVEEGVARKKLSWREEYENAKAIIERVQNMVRLLVEKGLIKPLE